MKTIVFAYHDVGCMGVRVLKRLGVTVGAVYTHDDDPGENHWFGSVRKTCADLGASCGARAGCAEERAKLTVPWFAFGFVAVVLFNSLAWLPAQVVQATTDIDTVLLAMAMAALGLSTHLGAIRKAGVKPLLLATVLFVWLVAGGALINRWVAMLLA